MKLGYKEHAWDWPNLFVISGIFNNQVGQYIKHRFGTEKKIKFVGSNQKFVIMEFVITEFHCSLT